MISEIITYKLRPGMTRAEVVAMYRKTSSIWRSNPDCIRKCYLYDAENHLGGGAYLWKNIAAAKRAHGEEWRRMINDLYGSEDQITRHLLRDAHRCRQSRAADHRGRAGCGQGSLGLPPLPRPLICGAGWRLADAAVLLRLRVFGRGAGASPERPHIALAGTRTSLADGRAALGARLAEFQGDGASAEVRGAAGRHHALLVSIPPDIEGDMVLRHFRDDLAALPDLAWVGYLSTVGVYGDWQGEWVDETARRGRRPSAACAACWPSRAWLEFGAESGRRVEVFRLSGIYGPGRSVIDNLRAGTARRIVKPGQVFNRIHVDDIALVLAAAIDKPAGHTIYNVSDDEPAPPQDVVAYAAELLGLPVPPEIPFEQAGLEGMAASFWAGKQARQQRTHQGRARRHPRLPDLPRRPTRAGERWLIATKCASRCARGVQNRWAIYPCRLRPSMPSTGSCR